VIKLKSNGFIKIEILKQRQSTMHV